MGEKKTTKKTPPKLKMKPKPSDIQRYTPENCFSIQTQRLKQLCGKREIRLDFFIIKTGSQPTMSLSLEILYQGIQVSESLAGVKLTFACSLRVTGFSWCNITARM